MGVPVLVGVGVRVNVVVLVGIGVFVAVAVLLGVAVAVAVAVTVGAGLATARLSRWSWPPLLLVGRVMLATALPACSATVV